MEKNALETFRYQQNCREKAKKKYLEKVDGYEKNKERLQKMTRNRYKALSDDEKNRKGIEINIRI